MSKGKTSKGQTEKVGVVAIIVAVIGLAGTVGVAFFNYRASVDQLTVPATLTEAVRTASIATQTLIVSPIPDVTSVAQINDDFGDRTSHWPIGEDNYPSSQSRKYILNGTYHWEITGLDLTGVTIEPSIPVFSDFDLSVDMKQVKGTNDIAYGVLFRSNPADGWYLFVIRNNGSYALTFVLSNGSNRLIPWTNSSSISVNNNRLHVTAEGDKIRLYINGDLAGEIINAQSRYGKVGLYASVRQGDEVAFEVDNFQLNTINK